MTDLWRMGENRSPRDDNQKGNGKGRSRFPPEMTERKVRATTMAKATARAETI
jgi:hypothetical protein